MGEVIVPSKPAKSPSSMTPLGWADIGGTALQGIGQIAGMFGPQGTDEERNMSTINQALGIEQLNRLRQQSARRDESTPLLNRLLGIPTNGMQGQQSINSMYQPVRDAAQTGMGYLNTAASRMSQAPQTFEQTMSGIEPMVNKLLAARQAQMAPQRAEQLRRLSEGSPVGLSRQAALGFEAQNNLDDTMASLSQYLPYAQASQQQQQMSAQQNQALASIAEQYPGLAAAGITPELAAMFQALGIQLG